MKIIIAGSRNYENYEELAHTLNKYVTEEFTEVVSGGARGADSLGEMYAASVGLPCTVMKADWKTNGPMAGFVRNRQMANYADCLIAFWDGKSNGTRNMINEMKKLKKSYTVIYV